VQSISTSNLLFVDMDGTLIKSDLMFESLIALLKHKILYLCLMPFWLLRGRAFFKQQLAKRIELPVELIPLNEEFFVWLQFERARGRSLTLISAADQAMVDSMSSSLGLFDAAIGSDGKTNLRSELKLERIKQLSAGGDFAYAGNSTADIPVWEDASEIIIVNASPRLKQRIKNSEAPIKEFDCPNSKLLSFVRAVRPHQWLKNLLVFLPLVLAHELTNPELLYAAGLAFISFSFCASSVYLLNDMLDLFADRLHERKRFRPFASGNLPLAYGLALAPLLLLASFVIAWILPHEFIVVLFVYWVLTVLYSFYIKRLYLADVGTLALLYTLRVVAGAAAIMVDSTLWLLTFSLLLFGGLAIAKRYTELHKLGATGESQAAGRAYTTADLQPVFYSGVFFSIAAVIVFAVYISVPATANLYTSPLILWGILPLLLFILGRIWRVAQRGELNDDPLLFALQDWPSLCAAASSGALIWLAI